MDWVDATDGGYWTAVFGSWDGSSWSSGNFGGYQFVSLTPGSWADGYSKQKIRLTYSLSALTLIVMGSSGYTEAVVDSGTEVDIGSIGTLTLVQFGGTETPFTVSKIEIYGDSLGEEEPGGGPVEVTAAVPGTSETWRVRPRPGGVRGMKHRPLRTRS